MTWKPDIFIYHFPCDDGFASAWIARRKWPDVVMAPTNCGFSFPDIDITSKNILIADFSYRRDEMIELGKRANSIVVLDHHKSAQAELTVDGFCLSMNTVRETDQPGVFTHFDMNRSGASLTWEFCFPHEPMPLFVKYIEDRDLWRFKLEGTRAFSLFLRSYPYDFDRWSRLAEELMPPSAYNELWREAYGIERFFDAKLAEMVPTATLKPIAKWKGVPVAHAPYAFASDLAHELLKKHPDAPFAAVIVDAYGGRTFSLRSEDHRQDVSEVARQFGGGGHRNAAGFRVPV